MSVNESTLSTINRGAVRVALAAIAAGLVPATLLIWGPYGREWSDPAWRLLGTAFVFFAASAATLCTIKFFYFNRDRQGSA
jgi:hypothetical protein